ncbi:isocitrate/isopropylmalate dehydrogenase family protein [Methanocella arvoryzae]|uniref:2-isopropylmalate dehydrogenase n=1 Tax=Methanocella arvoryzae (strain DSM 22066 / NBRC 105507 / MRE50) TaxID=351160 RepID=Q0W1Q6_METAR|nr:isocitrate/isopropylmalate dehydrogenase family protein [Methanocella arvoryzae]CAJ37687.1 2-isopropylmalate dehydrogenase [Methanocella arvoryzae MRE50]
MKIAVLPGDGIGREVVPVAHEVLKVALPDAEFLHVEVGNERYVREGVSMSPADLETVKACDCVLFGAITSPPGKPYRSIILTLRKELDLYANIRPFRSCPISPRKVNFTIYRENSEDLYMGIEEITGDEARSVRVITRKASERIARAACSKPGIGKLTIVHKSNVLKADELFKDACAQVAKSMNVPFEDMLVDTTAYNLVRAPEKFDTIVTTNMFGDILSDEAAALIGSLGLSPSANVGDRYALFEPVHGSAPDIAGKGIANPFAAVLSAGMLLDWAGRPEMARAVQTAVDRTIDEGVLTPDLGGRNTTLQVQSAILKNLESII